MSRRVTNKIRKCNVCGMKKILESGFNKHGTGFKRTCIKCEEKDKGLKTGKSKKKARFLSIKHLRTDNDGCVTAACLVNPTKKEMLVGFSFCSPRDEFCKKKGKTIALKRMNSIDGEVLLFETPIARSIFEFLKKDSVYNDFTPIAGSIFEFVKKDSVYNDFTPDEDYPSWFPRFISAYEKKMNEILKEKNKNRPKSV